MTSTIASLIPSGTDIVAALGLGDRLVGVSHECDHPIADGLPVLTSSVLEAGLSAGEVDAAVSASVADGTSLYQTDRETLAQLGPSLVLSQDVCDVCAVNGEVARADIPDGAELIMLTAVRLAHLWEDLLRVARAAGVEEAGAALVADTRGGLAEVAAQIGVRRRPRVVALEWGDPLYIAGHWVPELIDLAGGEDALGEVGTPSRRVTLDEVRGADPDVVLVIPCGYGLEQAAESAATIPLGDLRAARMGQVWALDATRLFSRCTPQAVTAGARALASVLHPDASGLPAPVDARRVQMPAGVR